MRNNKNLESGDTANTSPDLNQANISLVHLHLKMDELIVDLTKYEFDTNTLKELKDKFDQAIDISSSSESIQTENVEAWDNTLYQGGNVIKGRLVISKSRGLNKNLIYSWISLSLRLIISLLLILLGIGMIIMPAPDYFEMFTLFYLNPNDGVTIMDIISLIVVFTGTLIFIGSLMRFKLRL